MSESDYAQIAAGCDRLLRAPGSGVARLAIPALHLVSEHPASLGQYQRVLAALQSNATSTVPWFAFADRPRAWLRDYLAAHRARKAGGYLPRAAPPLPPQTDVLIVSHLGHPSQLSGSDDFYFGPLQQLLRERGRSSLRLLIDHTNPAHRGHSVPPTSDSSSLLLPPRARPGTEHQIQIDCTQEHRRLRAMADTWAATPLERGLTQLASRQVLSGETAANLRLFHAVRDLCCRLRPQMIVTTHEGAAVERLIWAAARRGAAGILCVGYQHARLLERAHAIRRPVAVPGLDCDPDVVLTSGAIPQARLAASAQLTTLPLISYGTHRRRATADTPLPLPARPPRCLVIPDADELECRLLFGFALACARQTPGVHFALRPHPGSDRAALVSSHPQLRRLPANVSLPGSQSLQQELSQARYCLYRGSSAVVQAVIAQVKPFYLARPGELPIDPLYELTDWRESITSPRELSARMQAADAADCSETAARASRFCSQYLSPLRPAGLDELLQILDSHAAAADSRMTTRSPLLAAVNS